MNYIAFVENDLFIYLLSSKGTDRLTITLLSVYLQGLLTTTISPHSDLLCPLHTTTNPYPTSLPTVSTETPWEGDVTPFTPPPQAPEMVQLPQSLSSSKTAGSSTATSHWRRGQNINFLKMFVWRQWLERQNHSSEMDLGQSMERNERSCRFNVIPVSNRLHLPQKNKGWGGLSSDTYNHRILTQALKQFLFAILREAIFPVTLCGGKKQCHKNEKQQILHKRHFSHIWAQVAWVTFISAPFNCKLTVCVLA